MSFITKHIVVATLVVSLMSSALPANAAVTDNLQQSLNQLSSLLERLQSRLFGQVAGANISTYPNLKNPRGHNDPVLAYGLTSINNWEASPFIDIVKSARSWCANVSGDWCTLSYEDLKNGGYLDENGWVTHIPDSATVQVAFAWGT